MQPADEMTTFDETITATSGLRPLMTPESRPRLWRLARLDFDRVRKRRVLLYPEGAMFLNETGAEILGLCDGRRTLAEIAALLGEKYGTDVTADVVEYLTLLTRRDLVSDAADNVSSVVSGDAPRDTSEDKP
jgi:pyrroloquinoline quinone biosynthesis protein D